MKGVFLLAGLFLGFVALYAQIEPVAPDSLVVRNGLTSENPVTIVDKINRLDKGKGVVRVIQDKSIVSRLGRPSQSVVAREKDIVEITGWRIQVFAGNDQRLSKAEAFRKETDIKTSFPELPTYVHYAAPFWRLRVGDFRTYKEAEDLMVQLKRFFTAFGREMSIVKEKIQVFN